MVSISISDGEVVSNTIYRRVGKGLLSDIKLFQVLIKNRYIMYRVNISCIGVNASYDIKFIRINASWCLHVLKSYFPS